MENQPTPGPWEYKKFNLQEKYAVGPDVSKRTADAYGLANARLIAAAPDLLEALKELVSIVAIHQNATENRFAWAEMQLAGEAIAKATGSQP